MSETALGASRDLTDGQTVDATRAWTWADSAPGLIVALAIVAGALALRIMGLGREAWLDEAATLRVIERSTWQTWTAAFLADSQPPAYPLLLTLWAQLSSLQPWLRALSLVAGLASVVVAMRWAALTSRGAMLLAGLLLATSPIMLRYSVELRPYAFLLLATAWAGLAASRIAAATGPADRQRTLSLGLALGLAVMTHFAGVLLVPAVVALMLATSLAVPSQPRWQLALGRIPWRTVAAVLLLAIAVLALQRTPVVGASDWWMPPLTPTLAASTFGEAFGLAVPGESGPTAFSVVGVFLFLAGLFVAARASASQWLPPLAAALVYWLAIAGISLLWLPIWWPRILAPGLIPLAIAVSGAVAHLPRASWRLALTALIIGAGAVTTQRWVAREARQPIEAWQAATVDLASTEATVPILCLPGYVWLPLDQVIGIENSRLVQVGIGLQGNSLTEQLTPALNAAARGGAVGLAVRIDLTFAEDPDALGRVVDELLVATPGTFTLHVALVTSPDVSLVPTLADEARAAELRLRARLGEPVERMGDARAVRLTFEIRPQGSV